MNVMFAGPRASFDFDGSETGNDFADYLVGAPSSFGQCSQQFLDSRSHYGAAFMQDSFRIKPNFTLNYGLRWEYSQPWWDTQGKIETIVPGLQSTQFPTAPLGWVVPGDPGIPKTLAPTDYNNFGPRIGLAYSPGFSDGHWASSLAALAKPVFGLLSGSTTRPSKILTSFTKWVTLRLADTGLLLFP